jgi:hypothetical protein
MSPAFIKGIGEHLAEQAEENSPVVVDTAVEATSAAVDVSNNTSDTHQGGARGNRSCCTRRRSSSTAIT